VTSLEEAMKLVAVLQNYAAGLATQHEAEIALAQLGAVQQINLRESVERFRAAMNQRGRVGGLTPSAAMIRASAGITKALRSFAFRDQQEGGE
jgi:hypothetical protein